MMYILDDAAFDQEGTPWVSQTSISRNEATRKLPLAKQRRADGVRRRTNDFQPVKDLLPPKPFKGSVSRDS